MFHLGSNSSEIYYPKWISFPLQKYSRYVHVDSQNLGLFQGSSQQLSSPPTSTPGSQPSSQWLHISNLETLKLVICSFENTASFDLNSTLLDNGNSSRSDQHLFFSQCQNVDFKSYLLVNKNPKLFIYSHNEILVCIYI